MITKAKISASQICIMLVVSRLFSIFTYKPQSYEIGAITSFVAIIISAVLSLLLFLPAFLLLNRGENKSISDMACIHYGNTAKIFSFSIFAVCIFLAVECLTQFEFFMSSTLYLTSSPIFFLIPMLAVAIFICHKGVETIARLSGFVFLGLIFAFVLIISSSLPRAQSIYIESMGYDNIGQTLRFIVDNVTHTTEIIPFLVLCENVKDGVRKGATWFVVISTILLEVISILTITTLGEYRKTILFPFYTISAMSQTSLTDRFSLAFIVLWVFMATIKLCIYLFVASKSFQQVFSSYKKMTSIVACSLLVFLASIITTDKISSVEIMYKIILTGLPIIIVAVLFPCAVLIKAKCSKKVCRDD